MARRRRRTLVEVADQWLAIQQVRPHTARCYRIAMQTAILPHLAELGCSRVSDLDLERVERVALCAWRDARPSSRRVWLRLLKRWLRWCWEHEYIATDLAARLRAPQAWTREGRERPTHRCALTLRQARALIRAAREPYQTDAVCATCRRHVRRYSPAWYHYAAIFIALRTGLRIGNVCSLRWGHLDLTAGTITLPAGETKSGREFRAPLHRELREWLGMRREAVVRDCGRIPGEAGRVVPITQPCFRYVLRTASARAGLEHLRLVPHDLRRTFGTWLAAIAPSAVVKQLLGHSYQDVTDLYTLHADVDSLRRWLDQLPPLLGGGQQLELWDDAQL